MTSGDVGPVHGVALPEVVGVGFGEGETCFWSIRIAGFEEIVAVYDAAEGIVSDLRSLK